MHIDGLTVNVRFTLGCSSRSNIKHEKKKKQGKGKG